MTNQANPQNMWGKNNHHSFRSPIIANSIPILIEQRKETELNQEKTPDLNELHFDGAYGSSDNDKKCEQHGITPVQTAVRGPKPAVEMSLNPNQKKLL